MFVLSGWSQAFQKMTVFNLLNTLGPFPIITLFILSENIRKP